VKGTDHLAAELDDPAVGQRRLPNPSAGPVARLHDEDVRARLHQIACRAEAGQPGAHHNDAGFHGKILT
jgi:hypothetical protein